MGRLFSPVSTLSFDTYEISRDIQAFRARHFSVKKKTACAQWDEETIQDYFVTWKMMPRETTQLHREQTLHLNSSKLVFFISRWIRGARLTLDTAMRLWTHFLSCVALLIAYPWKTVGCFFKYDPKEENFPLCVFTLYCLWSLISFLKAPRTKAWQQRWCSSCRDRGGRGGGRVLGMSSQIVSTFHLVASLSIPLFICISAGVCANPRRVSLCTIVCNNCQNGEADSLLWQGL